MNIKKLIYLFSILFLFTNLSIFIFGAIPASERAALIAIYNSTNGDSWTNNSGWKTPPLDADGFAMPGTESGWNGLTVTGEHVQRIFLGNNNLTGSIPGDIGDLGYLTTLAMNSNNLIGSLPTELFTLTSLSSINLSSNSFSNIIIDNFLPLINLNNLEMSSCNISGSIPSTISTLSKLQYLILSNNNLTGSLPPELANLSELRYLWLSGNNIVGSILPELGNLTEFTSLHLGSNNLGGTFPVELCNLTSLSSLSLSYNHIYGTLPSAIGDMTSLTSLILSNNQFYGSIPTSIENLVSLQFLYLDDNDFSGVIPPEIGSCTALKFLYLDSNSFMGSIPPEMGNLSDLMILEIDFNYLSGSIPAEFGDLDNLSTLNLHSNQLTGSIPAELGDMDKIDTIKLSHNKLSGDIPEEISESSTLHYFYIGANNFVGLVPDSLLNLSNAFYIQLSNNGFYTNDSAMKSFLEVKSPFWSTSQTIAPADISGNADSSTAITLSWTPVEFTTGVGSYMVYSSTVSGGNYTLKTEIADKTTGATTINGLLPDTNYYFVIRTRTYASINNKNEIISDFSEEVPVKTLSNGGTIIITSPSSSVSCAKGSTYNITWNKTGTQNANVKIRLYQNGIKILGISDSTANDGSYSWTIPDSISNNTNYIVRVKTLDNLVYDDSDEFTITDAVATITMTSPDSGVIWNKDTLYTITWDKTGTQNANVKIRLYQNGSKILGITDSTANDGSYSWTIPGTISDNTNYIIRVKTLDNLVYDDSDEFTISDGGSATIIMTSPGSGVTWNKGSLYTITWDKTGTQNANVKIRLYQNGLKILGISDSTPNDGSYSWTIPVIISNDTNYIVRIKTVDNQVYDDSDELTIRDAGSSIIVTTPGSGVAWTKGSQYTITWDKTGAQNANVKIRLYQNGSKILGITDSTLNDGSYSWTIPGALPTASNYIIRVKTIDNLVHDDSNYFIIN